MGDRVGLLLLEITAALLYYYGWDKLPAKLHEWYGWIYFIAAYLSLVVINGIVAFMLTSGKWVETHQFWSGFFNPTYFPSLLFRSAICFALAGIYALITASILKDAELKARIVRWRRLVHSAITRSSSRLRLVVHSQNSR